MASGCGTWTWRVEPASRRAAQLRDENFILFFYFFHVLYIRDRRQVESASWDGLGALHRDLTKKEKTSAKNFLLVEERDRASEIRKRRRRAQERGKNEKVTSSQSSRNLKKNRFSPGSKKKINRLKCP